MILFLCTFFLLSFFGWRSYTCQNDGKLDMLLGVSSRRVLEEESFEQVLKSRRGWLCFSSARNTVHAALSPGPSDLRYFDCLTWMMVHPIVLFNAIFKMWKRFKHFLLPIQYYGCLSWLKSIVKSTWFWFVFTVPRPSASF